MCEMCLCLARGGVGGEGGEWMRGMGLGFTNPVGTCGVLDVSLCFGAVVLVGWVVIGWGVVRRLGPGFGGWGCVMFVCVVSLDYLCRCQVQVSVSCAWRIPAHLRCTQF